MSDILCRWLNQELQLSTSVEPTSFAKDFANGYLIGEVLHKYHLQKDFRLFLKKDTLISKVNNFTRLEPTLKLLGISFDLNTAQALMEAKQGVATRFLHQLYLSLEMVKTESNGRMMEMMQPAPIANLHEKENEIYTNTPHPEVGSVAEIKFPKISQRYQERCQELNDRSVNHPIQQKNPKLQVEKGMKNTDKDTYMHMPKPPPYPLNLKLKKRHEQKQQLLQCKEQEAKVVQAEISHFETNRRKLVSSSFASLSSSRHTFPPNDPFGGGNQGCEVPGGGSQLVIQSNCKYIQAIRQRLQETAASLEQRRKRRDRFLMEQLKTHEALEEAKRNDQMVRRLTRQTRQEQRLAAQLLQTRMQKEVILKNRLFREQQYQQRRERDFQEALDREAALIQQAKLDHAEEIRIELECAKRMVAERAQNRYKKHFNSCKEILEHIVDLAIKTGEYRLLTGNLIPEKQVREWKELFFSGLTLYEPRTGHQPGFHASTILDPVELEKQELLNNLDYDQYADMVGEWGWQEEAREMNLPLTNNDILGHVIQRLRNILHPPLIESTSPLFPPFNIKACTLGKLCSVQTTCLSKTAEALGINVLMLDMLVKEALNAYKKEVQVTEMEGDKDGQETLTSSPPQISDLHIEERTGNCNAKALLGAAAAEDLRNGKAISNELLVDIIVEAIRQGPPHSGWILVGFPLDITQAHLLEKALGGSVDEGCDVVDSRTNLAADPNPLKPAPPPVPALDVALLLDVPDEQLIIHAVSHMDTDCAAAITSETTEELLYLAQIPHRIADFWDTWPHLEEWFGKKKNILVHVDSNVNDEELCTTIHFVLQQVMQKEIKVDTLPVEDATLESIKTPDTSLETSLTLLPPIGHILNEKNGQEVEQSGSARPSSVSNEGSQTFDKNPSCCDPSSHAYVDEPLHSEIPKHLSPYWDRVCDSYVSNVKKAMEQIRSQQTLITHHLFQIRGRYKHYLDRPDLKQEIVSQWQKDFNIVQNDMREDDDTKAELHLRLDELRERLWDISDKRKAEDKQEKTFLMNDDWLKNHTNFLINHHCVLIQVELNRFQETLCLLRVYYFAMCRQTLPELPYKLFYLSLIDTRGAKEQNESVMDQMDDEEDEKKIKFTALLKCPESSEMASKMDLFEPHEKLVNGYKEAIRVISKMVLADAHQMETKEQKESMEEKEEKDKKEPAGKSKVKKSKQPSLKQKGPSPSPAPSPAPDEEQSLENATIQQMRKKILVEYAAALNHEDNAAKVRIALVKSHGLVMIDYLQAKAQEYLSSMEERLQACYLASMKSIDQLTNVIGHHIEAGIKLQNELVLEVSDFYLNADCLMVHSPTPVIPPSSLENPTPSTSTIGHLQSLIQQLCIVAPSGFMCCSDFFSFLQDLVTLDMSKKTLPGTWIGMNEMQLTEIVSSLTNDDNLVDWRQFLLNAALPWPSPTITQLLDVLKHFKDADTEHTGYINEEQYSQTELWFSTEKIKTAPDDHLANLPKFIFQLFADHTNSPPLLDYVSMLLYFAADSNCSQGFVRALIVVVAQHVDEYSSLDRLVKSMPSIEENSQLDGDFQKYYVPSPSTDHLGQQKVSIPTLLSVIFHKITKLKEISLHPSDCPSQEEYTKDLSQVFGELGFDPEDSIPFSILSQHLFIQELIETSTQYQLVNISKILQAPKDEDDNILMEQDEAE